MGCNRQRLKTTSLRTNFVIDWSTLLLRICEDLGLNLSAETRFPDRISYFPPLIQEYGRVIPQNGPRSLPFILNPIHYVYIYVYTRLSQWPRGLRRRAAAARVLKLWVRIPPGAWMFLYCECSVFSGRRLCNELITRPEETYQLWCVVVCDLETS